MIARVVAVAVVGLAMVLAAATTPLNGTDRLQLPAADSSQSAELDFLLMEDDMRWAGPARGCAAAGGAGGELELECALEDTLLKLTTDRAAQYLTIKCETAGNLTGSFTCEELRNSTREALWKHTGEALLQHAGQQRVLASLAISDCVLAEPLRCLLSLVAATDVASVTLDNVSTPLEPDLVQGLSSVNRLRLLHIDANVTRLPYAMLSSLVALRRLDVHGGAMQLAAGGEDWASAQRQLLMLELAEGGLRALPARAFASLEQLRNLSLWMNQIETLDENAFEGLSQLQCLSLNQNKLRALPGGLLLPTPRLQLLRLYYNRITSLPSLGHLADLQELWVNNKNETSLSLHNDTFTGLSALQRLRLEACGLESLPPGLLAGQAALRALSLGHNRLRSLPPTLLHETRALEDLKLNNNELKELPRRVFFNLAALDKLDLSRNKLRDLHQEVFVGLGAVREVSLSYNELSMSAGGTGDAVSGSPLAGLRSLTRIHLQHNRVQQFMDDWRVLPHLELLNLSYNHIKLLSEFDLQLLSEAEVDVRHNNITVVQQLAAGDLEARGGELSRARFLLDDNPFHCDCLMYSFVAALRRSTVAGLFDVGHAVCRGPPDLTGTPLTAVPLDRLYCPLPSCAANCSCGMRSATGYHEVTCERAPPQLPPLPRGTTSVLLRLRVPPPDVATLPSVVLLLDLSGLGLTVPPVASRPVPHLTVNLSNNSLTSAPIALLDANATVRLDGNPLACDCEHRQSVASLLRHWKRVQWPERLRCAGGEWLGAKDTDALCAGRDALALGLGSGLAVALLVLILFRYRTEVRLILGRYKFFDFLLPKKDLRMQEKKYDAFVSFSHHDDAFVRDVLVPALEGGRRPLRLCLHYRDWEVGDLIPEQIDRSVRQSWRTIVVLSEDFVRSMWGRHEFRAAHGLERVIVLVLGDALRAMDSDTELRAYKKTHTCIMASNPLVWDRIRDAVYRSKCAAPAPDAEKLKGGEGTKGAGGLNVQLRNGQLVNEAVAPIKPTPMTEIPPLCNNLT